MEMEIYATRIYVNCKNIKIGRRHIKHCWIGICASSMHHHPSRRSITYISRGRGGEKRKNRLNFPDKGVLFREPVLESNEIDSPFTSICFRRASASFPSQLRRVAAEIDHRCPFWHAENYGNRFRFLSARKNREKSSTLWCPDLQDQDRSSSTSLLFSLFLSFSLACS